MPGPRWIPLALAAAAPAVAFAQPAPPIAAAGHARVEVGVPASGTISIAPAFPLHVEYGLDLGLGAAESASPLDGYGVGFAVPVTVYATPWLGFGVRGALVHSAGPTPDAAALDAWSATGGLRLRLWDDESRHGPLGARVGWAIDADGGYLFSDAMLTPPGPLARLSIGREVLLLHDDGNGVNVGMALAAEAGLGAASPYRALVADLWFHGESGAPAVTHDESWDSVLPTTWTFDVPMFLATNFGDVGVSYAVGLGTAVGLGVTDLIEPRVHADTLYLQHSGGGTSMLAASGGVRLRFDRWLPVFVDVLGGYEWAYGSGSPIGSGQFVDLGAGIHTLCGATSAELLQARLRLGVGPDNGELATLMLVLGGGHGSRPGALGIPRKSCR